MADIKLIVNGLEYAGWKRARVTRGIECLSGSFDLEVSERWNGQTAPWPILEEDVCEIKIDDETLISGYVDARTVSYSPTDHTLSVTGRDKSGALVDNSAVLSSWEFKDIGLLALAKKLADPFGISVSMDDGVLPKRVSLKTGKRGSLKGAGKSGKLTLPAPHKKFSVDPGESAFDVLDRACKMAGVLPISNGAGGILLVRPGTARASTALVEGDNIIAAQAQYDASQRYSRYVVRGQHQGSDEYSGESAAAVTAEASDLEVTRTNRILMIRPESAATTEYAKQRAGWEATVRAARSASVNVVVQGWTQADGSLWPVNAQVVIKSPLLGIDGTMLITQTSFIVDESGTTTELTLRRPDAFAPGPIIASGSSNVWNEIRNGV